MEENNEVKRNFLPVILLVLAGLSCILFSTYLNKTQNNNVTPQPSKTVSDSKEVLNPTLTKTPINHSISGLAPADIKVNLENKDFECTNAKTVKIENIPDSFLWYCDREDGSITYNVEFSSYSLKTVDSIDASVTQTLYESTELAEPFLSWFSTVAFLDDSAAQSEIKNWVSSSILNWNGSQKTITKKGVKFTLSGSEFFMLLTIEAP